MDVDTAERIGDALPAMLSVGVQTWGTDVTALERYWKAADDLGYARITYGDGLADSTHDGWTMLGARAVFTRRACIGPAVTYAFSHPETGGFNALLAVAARSCRGSRDDVVYESRKAP